MSVKYSKYLSQHCENVSEAYLWLLDNLPEVTKGVWYNQINHHDNSKYEVAEYGPYDEYFYGSEKTTEVKKNFNLAWLHHIHHNPHHWQHWILINDEPGEGMVILDMPYNYIVEMVCDWMSFSWAKGNLYEIFSWYDKHKEYMKLSEKTRESVEDILDKIKAKLEEAE